MKTLLSLFDYSRSWPGPFLDDGCHWDVWPFDLRDGLDINDFCCEYFFDELGLGLVEGILAAPPCTDFSSSGAQYWGQKDKDGRTDKSLELIYMVLRTVELFDPDVWAIENPVGRLTKLGPELGKPTYFNPCDYAGYLCPDDKVMAKLDQIRAKNGINVTNDESDFVVEWNAYNKKTGLWGKFNMPEPKRIEPVKCSPQGSYTQRLGGSSGRTKELRSWTPEGFAQAFYEINGAYTWDKEHGERYKHEQS